MKISPFTAWTPDFSKIPNPDSFFDSVYTHYAQYHKEGYFQEFSKTAIFIYHIQSNKHSYTGLVVSMPTEEYNKIKILKHEKTLAVREEKVAELLLERKACTMPVLLTYPAVPDITQVLQKYISIHPPAYSTIFKNDQSIQHIWAVEDPTLINQFQDLFNKLVGSTYIADGHHRVSTISLLQERHGKSDKGDFEQLTVALFGSDQLKIYEFNRVVNALANITPAQFLKAAEQFCTIETLNIPRKPREKFSLTIYLDQKWYSLKWKPSTLEAYENTEVLLDVQLLNDKLLKEIIGIHDIRFDKRIQYVPGTKGLAGLATTTLENPNNIGFYLYPVQIEELMTMADHLQLLPPKSTYFEPRVKEGFVVRRMD